MTKRILVCEDEDAIREFVVINLRRAGYDVVDVPNGEEALRVYGENKGEFGLALLDIMMPGMDGFTVCKRLREQDKSIGIIMLSAKSEDTDKIMGLNIGADDYVTKPFNPLELIARVKSQLRRYTKLGSAQSTENVFQTGGLTVDDERKEVTVDGEAVRMTPVECKILLLLIKSPGRVYSIDQIYEQVWNEPA